MKKRMVVYLPAELIRQAKSKAALEGLSLSEWVERLIREMVNEDEEEE